MPCPGTASAPGTEVDVINLATNTVSARLTAGSEPWMAAWNPSVQYSITVLACPFSGAPPLSVDSRPRGVDGAAQPGVPSKSNEAKVRRRRIGLRVHFALPHSPLAKVTSNTRAGYSAEHSPLFHTQWRALAHGLLLANPPVLKIVLRICRC